MVSELLIQVTLPYYTAGIVVVDGKVTDAAPICRWMVGMDVDRAMTWVRKRGGKAELVSGRVEHG